MRIDDIVDLRFMSLKQFIGSLKHAYYLIFCYPPLSLRETNYDDYWRIKRAHQMGAINSFQRARAQWIATRIDEGVQILDIGAGDGAVLQYLKSKKKISAVAADISDYALEYLESQGLTAIKFDPSIPNAIDHLPEADHIFLLEVLEHMQNPENFLLSVAQKARRSVFFSVPNSGYFAYRLRLLLGRSFMQWRAHPGEHLRFWTFKDLRWWLAELGLLRNATIHCYEGLSGLNRILPSLFAMGFVVELTVPTNPNDHQI